MCPVCGNGKHGAARRVAGCGVNGWQAAQAPQFGANADFSPKSGF